MRMPKSLFFSVEKRRNKLSLTGFDHVLVMRGSKASEGYGRLQMGNTTSGYNHY